MCIGIAVCIILYITLLVHTPDDLIGKRHLTKSKYDISSTQLLQGIFPDRQM